MLLLKTVSAMTFDANVIDMLFYFYFFDEIFVAVAVAECGRRARPPPGDTPDRRQAHPQQRY